MIDEETSVKRLFAATVVGKLPPVEDSRSSGARYSSGLGKAEGLDRLGVGETENRSTPVIIIVGSGSEFAGLLLNPSVPVLLVTEGRRLLRSMLPAELESGEDERIESADGLVMLDEIEIGIPVGTVVDNGFDIVGFSTNSEGPGVRVVKDLVLLGSMPPAKSEKAGRPEDANRPGMLDEDDIGIPVGTRVGNDSFDVAEFSTNTEVRVSRVIGVIEFWAPTLPAKLKEDDELDGLIDPDELTELTKLIAASVAQFAMDFFAAVHAVVTTMVA
jgi:hypothetical protein